MAGGVTEKGIIMKTLFVGFVACVLSFLFLHKHFAECFTRMTSLHLLLFDLFVGVLSATGFYLFFVR